MPVPIDFAICEEASNAFPLSKRIVDTAAEMGMVTLEFAIQLLFDVHGVRVTPDRKTQPDTATQIPGSILGSTAPGPWKRDVEVMVIGKKPGAVELERGRNFVGPTGQLMHEVCTGLGVDCSSWYVTNVCRYMPPNEGALTRYQVEDGLWFLAQEIAILRPRYLLVLGADAVKAVYGNKLSLSSVRSHPYLMRGWCDLGNITTSGGQLSVLERRSGYIQVLASLHPAAVLREAGLKDGLVADFKLFSDMLKGGSGIQDVKTNYRYIRTAEETDSLLSQLEKDGIEVVSLDAEWGFSGVADMRQPVLRSVQICWKAGEAAVFIFHDAGGIPAQPGAEMSKMTTRLRDFLMRPQSKIVGHNLRADAMLLQDFSINVMERFHFDSMLVDHVFNENAEHGLEACSVRYTPLGRYDLPVDRWLKDNGYNMKMKERHGYLHVPDNLLYVYGAKDADATFRIYEVLSAKLAAEPELKRCYDTVIHPACLPIHEMERNGIYIDRPRMEELVGLYGKKELELLASLRMKLNSDTFNPGSHKQVAGLLFGHKAAGGLGLVPVKTTGKPSIMWEEVITRLGEDQTKYSPSTDQETLEALADEHPIVSFLRDYRLISQIHKTFLRDADEVDTQSGEKLYTSGLVGYIGADGRIRTHINQMSETGRHKSSRPNCQNQPSKQDKQLTRIMGKGVPTIRSCFMASPGHVMIEADYKSAEIFTLGYLSGSDKLIKDAAGDLHSRGAVTRFGAEKWDGFNEGKAPPEEWKEKYKALRIASKTISFGEMSPK